MVVAEAFKWIRVQLQAEKFDEAVFDEHFLAFELLILAVIQKSKEFLLMNPNFEIRNEDFSKIELMWHRYLKGEPLAYLLGHKEFYGLDFIVDKRVLIPRPETELLVDKILEYVRENGLECGRILDVGTGSGCIALSLKKHLPNFEISGCDVSVEALEVANLNAEKLGLKVDFFKSDLMTEVSSNYDIIVANLPYIGRKSFAFVSKSTQDYEPDLALFSGDDGLLHYRKLFEQINAATFQPKLLLGEFGFLQHQELENILNKIFPQAQILFEKDLAHIERVFMVIFPRS